MTSAIPEDAPASLPQQEDPWRLDPASAATEVGLSLVVFCALFRVLSRQLTDEAFLRRWRVTRGVGLDIACKAVSAVFAVGASAAGVRLMASSEAGVVRERPPPLQTHVLLVVIAYFLYDLYAMYVVFVGRRSEEEEQQDKEVEKTGREFLSPRLIRDFARSQPLLIAHHLAIGVFFTPMMMTRLNHEPGELMIACALIFEASTPFVSMRAVLSHLGLRKSKWYVVNGLAMVVVFLCCRILVYPCFYYVYATQRNISLLTALGNSPKKCFVFQALVLLPQLYWFQVMVKGAVKVVQDKKDDREAKAE